MIKRILLVTGLLFTGIAFAGPLHLVTVKDVPADVYVNTTIHMQYQLQNTNLVPVMYHIADGKAPGVIYEGATSCKMTGEVATIPAQSDCEVDVALATGSTPKQYAAHVFTAIDSYGIETPLDYNFTIQSATPATDNLIVFGDSLSDQGNLGAAITNNDPQLGRHVWAYDLATDEAALKQHPFVTSGAFDNASRQGSHNPNDFNVDYAVGGAQTQPIAVGGHNIPGVAQQVASYVADLEKAGANPAKTKVLIWIGGNDILTHAYPGDNAMSYVKSALDKLIAAKVNPANIYVLNLPDISKAPVAKGKRPDYATRTNEYNKALAALVATYQGVTLVHVFKLSDAIFSNPGAATPYSFTNVTTACVAGGKQPDCDGYMSYDGIHPTAKAHMDIAKGVELVFKG